MNKETILALLRQVDETVVAIPSERFRSMELDVRSGEVQLAIENLISNLDDFDCTVSSDMKTTICRIAAEEGVGESYLGIAFALRSS